jgi:hypothetical protein
MRISDVENIELKNKKIAEAIDILLLAINDWSEEIQSLEEYECEIKKFIGTEINQINIETKLKNIDFNQYAWQAESLSQVLELFSLFNSGNSLRRNYSNIKNRSIKGISFVSQQAQGTILKKTTPPSLSFSGNEDGYKNRYNTFYTYLYSLINCYYSINKYGII